MKLFSKYNQILLIISFSGLLVIGFLFYRTLSYYLDHQIDSNLREELEEEREYVNQNHKFPEPSDFHDLIVLYKKTDHLQKEISFGDTSFLNPKENETESGRYLQTGIQLKGQNYQLSIIASTVEREDEIRTIGLIIILPVILLLLIVLLVNQIFIKRLWTPFQELLINIKAFNVNKEVPFKPINTPVKEFRELNDIILEMSLKVKSDYSEIKLFTENASHEMMTPLAVINTKLDMMLQSDKLGPEESETLIDLYKATSRLTKLNQSLLLLVKIDHNLLQGEEDIHLDELIKERLAYFQELINRRKLRIQVQLDPVRLISSRYLLEILVNNLFSNAIRHNYDGGEIRISLKKNTMTFSNTSINPALDQEKIFERFYKDNASEGTGLGLSILKQISNRQHYRLKYFYEQERHYFQISFDQE